MKKIILIKIFLVLFGVINAQYINLPASPEAESFKEYVDYPVSEYTGVPNINYPLFEISDKDLTLPVSISYHAGGIRVAEEASWVGLGWNLNAGGLITREIRDKDDFEFRTFYGYYPGYYFDMINGNGGKLPGIPSQQTGNDLLGPFDKNYIQFVTPGGLNEHAAPANVYGFPNDYVGRDGNQYDWFDDMCQDYEYLHDLESDLYSFNFLGNTGKFVIDNQGNFIPLNNPDFKIDYDASTKGFSITTNTGIVAKFGVTQTAQEVTTNAVFSGVHTNACNGNCDPADISLHEYPSITSWYLEELISPNGGKIQIAYTKESKTVFNIPNFSERKPIYHYRAHNTATNYSQEDFINAKLKTIALSIHDNVKPLTISNQNGDEIRFNKRNINRLDLRGGSILESVSKHTNNNLLKTWKFENDNNYFIGQSFGANYNWTALSNPNLISTSNYQEGGIPIMSPENESHRLKLNSIYLEGSDGSRLPPIKFTYNTTPLPLKTSMSQDFWGYYNGKLNTELLPSLKTKLDAPELLNLHCSYTPNGCNNMNIPNCSSLFYEGADRQADNDYCGIGMLNEITHNTGETTEFTFEIHEFSNAPELFEQYDVAFETSGSFSGGLPSCGFQTISNYESAPFPLDVSSCEPKIVMNISNITGTGTTSTACSGCTCNQNNQICRVTSPSIGLQLVNTATNQIEASTGYNPNSSIDDNDSCTTVFHGGTGEVTLDLTGLDITGGTYRVRTNIIILDNQHYHNFSGSAGIKIYYPDYGTDLPHVGGGMRIKTTKTKDKVTEYSYKLDGVTPDGTLLTTPKFLFDEYVSLYTQGTTTKFFLLKNITSNSIKPIRCPKYSYL